MYRPPGTIEGPTPSMVLAMYCTQPYAGFGCVAGEGRLCDGTGFELVEFLNFGPLYVGNADVNTEYSPTANHGRWQCHVKNADVVPDTDPMSSPWPAKKSRFGSFYNFERVARAGNAEKIASGIGDGQPLLRVPSALYTLTHPSPYKFSNTNLDKTCYRQCSATCGTSISTQPQIQRYRSREPPCSSRRSTCTSIGDIVPVAEEGRTPGEVGQM
jgi:hypothetical protein